MSKLNNKNRKTGKIKFGRINFRRCQFYQLLTNYFPNKIYSDFFVSLGKYFLDKESWKELFI
jgi:hypothetical protein